MQPFVPTSANFNLDQNVRVSSAGVPELCVPAPSSLQAKIQERMDQVFTCVISEVL